MAYGTGRKYNTQGETPVETGTCDASHRGGGLLFHYIENDTHRKIHVVDCVISNCVAAEGAAAYGVVLLRCRVTGNNTYREAGSTSMQCNTASCIFDGNGAVDYEGVLSVRKIAYPITSVNCTFFNNKGILRSVDARCTGTVFNAFIQCNGKTKSDENAYFAPEGWSGAMFTNCVADHALTNGANNVLMSLKADNAQLAAPIYGDFRPVANPYVKNVVGKGSKNYCSQNWIPSDDQNKDFFGNARWDGENAVSVGAIQNAVDVVVGCIMLGGGRYSINGRLFEGPADGYFYTTNTPVQFRLRLWSGNSEPASVWFGGHYESCRFPDLNGEIVVAAPPCSSDRTLYLRPNASKKTVWADPSYTGGDSDGSEQRPFATLQAAVDATVGFSPAVVKAKAGRYDNGGAYFYGNCRVVLTNEVCVRAVDGPLSTFIVGADGSPANPDGCGTNAYRCVGVDCNVFASGTAAGIVGFTLTGGRTCSNGEDCSQYCRYGGGLYANKSGDVAQFLDCFITNCGAVFASAVYNGWLQNCRIASCFQASNPAAVVGDTLRRGVVRGSYLSGCVIGPNNYGTVSIDANACLYNCTLNETSTTLHISKDAKLFNVLDLNNPTTQTEIGTTAGLCIETTATLAHKNCVKFPDAKIAAREQGDFRPLQDSPVLVNGTTNSVPDFHRYTIGGIHGGLFPAGTPVVGASYDVATPVTVLKLKDIEISGGLGTPFVSAAHPLTLTATNTARTFSGFLVNGELATSERTLTLLPSSGISSYTVEPLYSLAGLTIFVR